MNIRQKTYSALIWSAADKCGEQVLRFVFSIIMARLLLPEHFGLVGMTYVIIEIARVFIQSGFGLAIINESNVTEKDLCSVFYFNVFIGTIASVILVIIAPVIADFYDNKEVIPIIKLMSVIIFIGSFGSIHNVILTKKINFKGQAKVNLPSTFLSGVMGVLLAVLGYGVWALVYQAVFRTILNTLLLWFMSRWRPGFVFSLKSLKKLFRFGSKLLLGSIVQILFNNLYVIVIGKFFSPALLGYYSRAKQTQDLPVNTIWDILGRVTFPVMSSIKNDPEKLRLALSKASGNIAFVTFPLLVTGAIIAPSLFRVIFGERWLPCVPIFRLLCFANLFIALENVRANAVLSKGNSALCFRLLCLRNFLILISVAFSFRLGINVMLLAHGIIAYFFFSVYSLYTEKETGYSFGAQLSDLLPYALCTTISGLTTYGVTVLYSSTQICSLLLQIFTGATVYILCSIVLKLEAITDSREFASVVLSKIFKTQH